MTPPPYPHIATALQKHYHVVHTIGRETRPLSFKRLWTVKLTTSGLLVASKFPITQVEFQRFTNMTGECDVTFKGVVWVQIQVAEFGNVHIFNTHLQASVGPEYAKIREQQLTASLDFINTILQTHGEALTLFAGDLNVTDIEYDGTQTNERTNLHKSFFSNFLDLYDRDHDYATAKRKNESEAKFVKVDASRLKIDRQLNEPEGSFYSELATQKVAKLCIYDHILVHNQSKSLITSTHSELRRVVTSSQSDHLGLYAEIELH